ncbi:glycoside hydrolase family 30 protein [Mycena vulgaris]|nr:glycoside hydrolase family 30 protein [Mycena vulgaris]
MFGFTLVLLLLLTEPIASQQIYDIWQTTWDRSKLFTSLSPSSPVNFVKPGPTASADIIITDSTKYQSIIGFGGTLTDSSALILNNLKARNSGNYWNVLQQMFSPDDGSDGAGLSYLRVPIGATDFSAKSYSLDDVSGDTSFSQFNINNQPSYVFSVIADILSINSILKVHIVPWSPPAWMKDSGSMSGGSLKSNLVSAYPTYLLKAVQGFKSHGIPVFAISIQARIFLSGFPLFDFFPSFPQNEPGNSNPTYPSSTLTPATEGQIGAALRALLNNNGLSSVKIIGYDHNWDNAASYPVQLMQSNGAAFDGAAFHCYAGSVSNQDSFHSAFPSKNIYFTECSGTLGSDWWTDIKWYMDNLWIGSLEHYSQSGLMFNIALDGGGQPMLPGTNSCGSGCRPLVTVNGDGSYSYNQEFYSLAQASKAILPKDNGGPWGQRIKVSIAGSLGWALRVGAYATARVSSSDWTRYSLVVMNWNDNASAGWNPVPVTATIEFRGMQATYTFPVGVTTLWWFAPASGSANGRALDEPLVANVTDFDTSNSRRASGVAGRILL